MWLLAFAHSPHGRYIGASPDSAAIERLLSAAVFG
jgi:hypothetical protein